MKGDKEPMRVLVACEYSGVVRDAFLRAGHYARSCDLLPSDSKVDGDHYQGDVQDILDDDWDLMIAHPPCTHLAVSGAKFFAQKKASGVQDQALDFVRSLLYAKIPKIALENPISIISTQIRKPDQIVQPWWFGHMEQKSTCLWLKNLPPLTKTNDVQAEMMKLPRKERERMFFLPPSADRWKIRSQTYQGLADAMATQWGR
jgi:hypothetical protein